MSTEIELLHDALADMLPEPAAGPVSTQQLDRERWALVEDAGLTHLMLPSDAGGGDGSLEHVAAVLRVAGERAVALPLLETWLAGLALHRSGQPVPSGPLSFALVPDDADGSAVIRVPWGSDSVAAVIVTPDSVVHVDPGSVTWRPGTNLAGEPRDDLLLEGAIPAKAQAPCPPSLRDELERLAMLGRAVMVAGASDATVDLTVRHVVERQQFGRPLAAFQAVQHSVAEMVSAVAATTAACHAAVSLCAPADRPEASLAVLAAKSQANTTAIAVARAAHQLHGAIGFTDEHVLARLTARLWSWAQEDGTALACATRIADLAAEAESTWQLLVGG